MAYPRDVVVSSLSLILVGASTYLLWPERLAPTLILSGMLLLFGGWLPLPRYLIASGLALGLFSAAGLLQGWDAATWRIGGGSLLLCLLAGSFTAWRQWTTQRDARATSLRLRATERERQLSLTRQQRLLSGLGDLRVLVAWQDRRLRYGWAQGSWDGFDSDRFTGKSDDEIFPTAEAARLTSLKERVVEQGIAVRREIALTIDGRRGIFELTIEPMRDRMGEIVGLSSAAIEITRRKRIEQCIRAGIERQKRIADLAARALIGLELRAVLDEATALLRSQLGVTASYALELLPDGRTVALRSGSGWPEGSVGRLRQPVEPGSQLALALASTSPLVVEDLERESRFSGQPLLFSSRTGSTASMIIQTSEGLYGLLGVYSDTPLRFNRDEIDFLRGLAAVVAAAVSRAAAERQADHRAQGLRALFERNPEAMARLDHDRRIVETNPAFQRLVGRTTDELSSAPLAKLLIEDDDTSIEQSLERALAGESVQVEARLRRVGRQPAEVEVCLVPVPIDGQPAGWYLTARNLTGSPAHEAQRARQSLYDPLTGLPNGGLLLDRLQHALDRSGRAQQITAVLSLRATQIRQIHERDGYLVADYLVMGLTRRLMDWLRVGERIARTGEDEFTIVLENVNGVSDACRVAERLIEATWKPFSIGEREIPLTLSIGIAAGVSAWQSAASLLAQARAARLRVAESGRSGYEVFDRSLNLLEIERLRVIGDLQRAIERRQLRAFYQPIVDAGSGTVVYLEAVLHWDHPERGFLAPDQYQPFVADAGLDDSFGLWLLKSACEQVLAWRHEQMNEQPAPVYVGLPVRAFEQPGLAQRIAALLDQLGLPARDLMIELPEAALRVDASTTAAVVEELRQLGLGLALGGMGAGSLSLGHLMRLPVDVIKLDPALTSAAIDGGAGANVVRRLAELGRVLEARVVAPGIESPEQLTRMRALGCHLAQGPLYSDALPASSLSAFVRIRH